MSEHDFLDKDHPDQVVSSLEYIDYIERYVPDVPPIYTGMPMLDKKMGGVIPGELWVLSGKSKHGKSTFMRTLVREYYRQGALSMVFSYEETHKEFFEKFQEYKKGLLFYVPRHRYFYDIDKTLQQAKEAKEKFGTKIFFIDSGQKIVEDVQKEANLAHVAGQICAHLKNFAVIEEVVVWLVWHIKKDTIVTLESLSPGMLRDTGRLEQESDGMLFIFRDVKDNGVSKIQENYIKIAATRRSGAFNDTVPIVKRGPFFKEYDFDDVE